MTKTSKQTLPTVRVIRAPRGNSPEWIRNAWKDVELPICKSPAVEREAPRRTVHAVRVADAVEALRSHGRESAALWWNDQALARPAGARVLFFHDVDCQRVEEPSPASGWHKAHPVLDD